MDLWCIFLVYQKHIIKPCKVEKNVPKIELFKKWKNRLLIICNFRSKQYPAFRIFVIYKSTKMPILQLWRIKEDLIKYKVLNPTKKKQENKEINKKWL